MVKYSPRMWRWSCHKFSHSTRIAVFSTYVEVIPWIAPPEALPFCILHVCGGDPVIGQFGGSKSAYSPRMWRWSLERQALNSSSLVFSTYVEVIPLMMKAIKMQSGILHTCGGDPIPLYGVWNTMKYSPRMWRWSQSSLWYNKHRYVFSTHVESVTVLERTDK